ncbi:hypothetical protein XAPC_278 [Xanthomonas citri pv. punicae str. LMG 859]|nr:hypothetical protein XAPC_278 [Xanthomonas citri pv. punicae str. LMG 859]
MRPMHDQFLTTIQRVRRTRIVHAHNSFQYAHLIIVRPTLTAIDTGHGLGWCEVSVLIGLPSTGYAVGDALRSARNCHG